MKMHATKIVIFLIFLFAVNNANACGWDGCFFSRPGDFVSNGARDAQNMAEANLNESLAIVRDMSQGDVNAAVGHVGRLVVEGQCFVCEHAISNVAGDAGVATVEQMVTVGFMVLTDAEVGPIFVTYDAKNKKGFVGKPVRPAPNVFASKGDAKKHPKQSFEATIAATCIVANTRNRTVVVGFQDPPALKNLKTNTVVGYFESLLGPGDTVLISAPLCPAENSRKNHQTSIDKVTLVYAKESPVQRTGQKIHYELIGRRAQ